MRAFFNGPIARATLSTTAVLVLRLLAQMGTLLIVARLLEPENFGLFAGMAALAVTFGALSTFGTHLLLLREVSRAPNQPASLLPVAIGTTLLSSSALLGAYLLLTILWLQPPEISLVVLIAIGLSDILLLPLLQIPGVERQGQGKIAESQLLIALPHGLRLLAAITVAVWHPEDALTIYALAYAMAALITLPIGVAALRQDWPHWRDWRLPKRHEWREATSFAALNLTALGPTELDKTIAVHLLPAMAAGTYAAGSRVMGPLVLPVLAMMLSALPRLFREHNQAAQGSRLLSITLLVAVGYGLLAALGLWLSAPLIAWLFGAQYAGLTSTLHWLTLAVPGMALRYVTGNALMTTGHPWLRVGVEMVGLLGLGIAAVLLMHEGTAGIALALACSEWTMALLGFIVLQWSLSRQQGA